LLAIETLLNGGLNDFLLDLGHIGFFDGLIADADIPGGIRGELINAVANKDLAEIDSIFDAFKIRCDKKTVDSFKALPSLYGGAEVLLEAKKLTANKPAAEAVDSLRNVYNAVKLAGYEKFIALDLGLLKNGYYTGLVVKGITKDYGATILDGGRYDDAVAGNAIGFAVGTKRFLSALEASVGIGEPDPCDCAYINLDGYSKSEFDKIRKLKSSGKKTVKLFVKTKAELIGYCKNSGIKNALVFDADGIEEIKID
jgi:ATP phosphoribosyltransferase regulatory subunit